MHGAAPEGPRAAVPALGTLTPVHRQHPPGGRLQAALQHADQPASFGVVGQVRRVEREVVGQHGLLLQRDQRILEGWQDVTAPQT